MEQMNLDKVYQIEQDSLDLKKYVDQILLDLNEYKPDRLKLKRRAYGGKKLKTENEVFELKELPFVF